MSEDHGDPSGENPDAQTGRHPYGWMSVQQGLLSSLNLGDARGLAPQKNYD